MRNFVDGRSGNARTSCGAGSFFRQREEQPPQLLAQRPSAYRKRVQRVLIYNTFLLTASTGDVGHFTDGERRAANLVGLGALIVGGAG